ncbi:hypothetical protein D1157_14425, partial [Anaerotruncus sp. X29]|nr:hypothetical protein [Anaerotruncus sp. X29]
IHIASWLYFRTFIWFVQYLFFKQALKGQLISGNPDFLDLIVSGIGRLLCRQGLWLYRLFSTAGDILQVVQGIKDPTGVALQNSYLDTSLKVRG